MLSSMIIGQATRFVQTLNSQLLALKQENEKREAYLGAKIESGPTQFLKDSSTGKTVIFQGPQ